MAKKSRQESRQVINALFEGPGEPGYDIPLVWKVTFMWQGRKYVKHLEAANKGQKKWAINRAIASVLLTNGVPRENLPHDISVVLADGNVQATLASMELANPIPYRRS